MFELKKCDSLDLMDALPIVCEDLPVCDSSDRTPYKCISVTFPANDNKPLFNADES